MNIAKRVAVALIALTPWIGAQAAEPIIAGSVQPNPAELERGRYLVQVTGCNDCHTAGYAQSGGRIDEEHWLLGDGTGHEGPWGTSFPSNLRLTLLRFTDEQWLDYARTLSTRPPMPWFALRAMNDTDLLAILRFVQWLGPKGEPAPPSLAPGEDYIGPMVRYSLHSD